MFDLFLLAAQNECTITTTPLYKSEEYDGREIRSLCGWRFRIDKGSKWIERIINSYFPFSTEEAYEQMIKSMIEELNKGGEANV